MKNKAKLIAELIEDNIYEFDDLKYMTALPFSERIPRINLGRQNGHTTALELVISRNPEKQFIVTGMTLRSYIDRFGCLKNSTFVNTHYSDTCSNKMRGRRFDIMLIDNGSCMKWDKFEEVYEEMTRYAYTRDLKIFMVG